MAATTFRIPAYTQQEVDAQQALQNHRDLSWDRIERIYGDSKHASFWTTTLGGDMEAARSLMRRGLRWEMYYSYQAMDLLGAAATSLVALPAIATLAMAHTFNCESQIGQLRAHDYQNLSDAVQFILSGTVWGLSKLVMGMFLDPLLFIYRCFLPATSAMIFIDMQLGFMEPRGNFEGGSLGVPGSWDLVHLINDLSQRFGGPIFASADHHPIDHKPTAKMTNVADNTMTTVLCKPQMAWNNHCVQGTREVQFAYGLDTSRVSAITYKGENRNVDSYSAFFDNNKAFATELAQRLWANGVRKVYIVGLCFNFCVGFSALDAKALGFEVVVIDDASRSIGNDAEMRQRLIAAGCTITTSAQLLGIAGAPADPNFTRQVPPPV